MLKLLKRVAAVAVAVMAGLLPLSGCGEKETGPVHLSLTIASNKNMDEFLETMQSKFDDIDFDIYWYTGYDSTDFLRYTIERDDMSDIVFHTQKVEGELAKNAFVDLSDRAFIKKNVDDGMVKEFTVDGHIYQIPGPITIRSMAYNKTMFEDHGWEMPKNFEELVALVGRIREEAPTIMPLAMALGANGAGYSFTTVTTFSQAGFLTTAEGAAWQEKYLSTGEGSVSVGWGEGFEMLGRLIDAGAFYRAEECYNKWDDRVAREFFMTGEAAMFFVWGNQKSLVTLMDENESYEFELFPFYSLTGGRRFLGVNASTIWSICKKLEKPGNKKKLDAAMKVMEWLTTSEAQGLLVESPTEIPALKSPDVSTVSPQYKKLWELSARGDKAPMIYTGFEDVLVPAGEKICEYILSGSSAGMAETVSAIVDEGIRAGINKEPATQETYGVMAGKCDERETVQLIANILNDIKAGDFALVSMGGLVNTARNNHGVSGRVYPGELSIADLRIMQPSSGNNAPEILTLTGAQVKELIAHGKTLTGGNNQQTVFDYYWSGLEVTMQNGVVSAKLNGTELADDATYRVVFCKGDYTSEVGEAGSPAATEVKLEEILKEYFRKNSPVAVPEVLR